MGRRAVASPGGSERESLAGLTGSESVELDSERASIERRQTAGFVDEDKQAGAAIQSGPVAGIALAQINVFAGAINHPYGRSTAVARAVTVDVTRASIPLPPVATGSVEAGQQPSIALGGDAPELLRAASTEPVAV